MLLMGCTLNTDLIDFKAFTYQMLFLITAGVCRYADGSKYGLLSLHQLTDYVPSLQGSRKEVRHAQWNET